MNEQIDRKLAQQIVDTVKDVCGQNVNFIDGSGLIYASTDAGRIGSYHEIGRQAAVAGKAIEVEADDRFTGTQKGGEPAGIPQRLHGGGDWHQRTAR